MTNYQKALCLLQGSECKRLEGNTLAVRGWDCAIVRYHDVEILVVDKNGEIRISNDGFFTRSTKDRINKYLALLNQKIQIHVKDGIWYIQKTNGQLRQYVNPEIIKNGRLLKPVGKPKSSPELVKQIRAYVKGCCENYENNDDLDECLFCQNEPNGELLKADHLRMHIEQKQFTRLITMNALMFGNCRTFGCPTRFFKTALNKYIKKHFDIATS